MSKEIIYIDYDEALNIYGKMIDASDGGFEGVRDEGGIRATLDFVQNDLYYPTFADKLTYLMYRFCSGHFFNDGNKRIALTLGAYFLHKNNYYWHACICMRTLESIIYHVAASNIDQDLLLRIVNSFLTSKDYDEELKIDIANAIAWYMRNIHLLDQRQAKDAITDGPMINKLMPYILMKTSKKYILYKGNTTLVNLLMQLL